MKSILLIGANGQLGSELCTSLHGLGEITALTRQALDLGDQHMIRSVVRARQPSLIINAAGYTAVDQAESEPTLAHRINATAPGVLAEEAAQLGVPLMHYSTDYVFDGQKSQPYDEGDGTCPLNVYGQSKRAGELAVQASGCRHLIFRTSWLYSAHGQNFVKTMLRVGAEKGSVRVVQDQWGAPTWARSVADATAVIVAKLLRDSPAQGNATARDKVPLKGTTFDDVSDDSAAWWSKHSGIYHMCAEGRTTWAEFAATIFDLKGMACAVLPIPGSAYPTPARRPRAACLSTKRLTDVFGVCMPQWQDALATFLNKTTVDEDVN